MGTLHSPSVELKKKKNLRGICFIIPNKRCYSEKKEMTACKLWDIRLMQACQSRSPSFKKKDK